MGISGALVAILLVVVAIAFVGIAVAVMSGFLGTASVKTDIMVEKLDLVASGQSVVVIRNTGNVRIASLEAATLTCGGSSTDIDLTSEISAVIIGLDPGKTSAATFKLSDAISDIAPGETCTLSITANAANGAKVAASASAIVRP
jgi:hypothetical protein